MGDRQEIQAIPGALRLTLEKAHAEYGAVARKIRWGDGPVYVCGAGECAALGVAAGYALEYFLGLPVVARPVEVFQNYGLSLLRPRSVLLMIFGAGEWPDAQELARAALERGCSVVALTNTPDGPLLKLADYVLTVPATGEAGSPAVAVAMHAALNLLAFEAMRALKKPQPWWEPMERELGQLPEKLEWVFAQLPSAVRSLAAEMARLARLRIVGGGFYHFPASRAARQMQILTGLPVEGLEASDFESGVAHFARPGDTLLFLSGSHSKMKKVVHRSAAKARANGARVLSLTDGNDRDLAEGSDLGILVPEFQEAPASTLILFMLEWLAMEALRAKET